MLTIATCLWDANAASRSFSRIYDESWAEKLYRGFARYCPSPFRFVVYSDRERVYGEPIEQARIEMSPPHYGAMIEPFKNNEPCIVVGLDTIVVGDVSALAEYCMTADKPAIPRDPYVGISRWQRTNAVVLAPAGCKAMLWDGYAGENDMDWINTRDTALLDDVLPGACVSYKGRVQHCGLEPENRVVFFHGPAKPHELPHVGWVGRHWHDNLAQEKVA